jgi:hypothetical protein
MESRIMTKVVLQDAQTVATLDALHQRAEICDAAGRVLGYYMPRETEPAKYYKGIKSPFSKEELERRYREGAADSIPLTEFWERMKKKYPEEFE